MLLFLHFHGCAIWFVASYNNTWWPVCDIAFDRVAIYTKEDPIYTYATSIYYSLRLFTIHDIGPTAIIERTMFGIFAVVGAMVNANIVGNIYVLVGEMNAKSNEF